MVDLASYLYRAVYLLGLAIAPRVFSPDPTTPNSLAAALLVPLAVLGIVLGGAVVLKKRIESREGRVAAALLWVSVAAAIGGALYFTGPRAPLAHGAAVLALIVWPTLAATAAALAGEYLGSDFKHKRTAVAALVIAGGLFVHGDGKKNMGDTAHMWSIALAREPAHEVAFEQVTRPLLTRNKLDDVNKRAATCLRANPAACVCLVARATVAQKKHDVDRATQMAGEAAKTCPNMTAARAVHVDALVLAGKNEEALAEADEALLLDDDPARAHGAKATALAALGKMAEAVAEAEKAVGSSSGREASLLIAFEKITSGDLDGAETLLRTMLGTNAEDADVRYNLALIAEKRNKYNDARNGYLAALKIDPSYKAARYNLALLTWRRGVTEEAKNHAKKYAEMAPNDPATMTLMQTVFGETPAQSP